MKSKIISTTVLLIAFISCLDGDKKKYADILRNEECNIVLESVPSKSVWFKAQGYNPITGEPKICKTSNRWWDLYVDEMDIGDTIVKKKGSLISLIFEIHKKDTVISHCWYCDEDNK